MNLQKHRSEFWAAFCMLTRLPAPELQSLPPQSQAIWAYPLIGAIIGSISAIALLLAAYAGVPAVVGAIFAVTTGTLVTGALHEDGLADFFDGLGGGKGSEEKLAIMRDSHIGSYGTIALILTITARIAILASLPPSTAALALVASHSVARGTLVLPLWLFEPARTDGLGHAVGRPSVAVLAITLGFSLFVAFVTLGSLVTIPSLLTAVIICQIAKRYIGGYTGDVLGAAEQFTELVVLLVALLLYT
jgi:adenosylcobinamide-GDP ribazoletransferase